MADTFQRTGRVGRADRETAVSRVRDNPGMLESEAKRIGAKPETLRAWVDGGAAEKPSPRPRPVESADPVADAVSAANRVAASQGAPPAAALPTPGAQPAAPPPPPPAYTIDDITNAIAGLTSGGISVTCALRKIKLTKETAHFANLSREEIGSLKPAVQACEADLRKLLFDNRYIAIGFLVTQLGMIIYSKTEQIKQATAPKESETPKATKAA